MHRKTVNAFAVIGGSAATVLLGLSLVRGADKPAAPAPAPAPAMMAAPATQPVSKEDNDKRFAEIPNLRDARLKLFEVRKTLQRDVVDPKGYRHEALDHVNQAIELMTNEINEYKGDAK